jgi:hypothetical protein
VGGVRVIMELMKQVLSGFLEVTVLRMDLFSTLAVLVYGGVQLRTMLIPPLTITLHRVTMQQGAAAPNNGENQFVASGSSFTRPPYPISKTALSKVEERFFIFPSLLHFFS